MTESQARGLTVWRVVVVLGKIAAVLAALAAIAVIGVWYTLQQSYGPMEGRPAPVMWVSERVMLSADRPLVRGSLTLSATSVTVKSSALRVGVNAGTPSSAGSDAASGPGSSGPPSSLAPGAILQGALTRLTATSPGRSEQSCLAPCELQLSALDCGSGTCRAEFDITIELLGEDVAGAVSVDVSGGATAGLEAELPAGLEVELAVGGASAPVPT